LEVALSGSFKASFQKVERPVIKRPSRDTLRIRFPRSSAKLLTKDEARRIAANVGETVTAVAFGQQ
jgi:hypothetical protein